MVTLKENVLNTFTKFLYNVWRFIESLDLLELTTDKIAYWSPDKEYNEASNLSFKLLIENRPIKYLSRRVLTSNLNLLPMDTRFLIECNEDDRLEILLLIR
jgi:hypothetical protein